ncbi:hypothetical protein MAPG_07116 [Magnaporthiopsis poae ATCC 64411]|uniref:Something about silencing protein 4 domain-containing protein n=1 Tax=Magnaporthiopsis poae (strain ATCC 64411 / 73-15) TaxID=644358 RepID=A0A0C4E3U3_MAGP6|nr:hypothetical protein MAPG_07116 [Magnaporthiopsis poae ATCC 64411]
MYFPSVSMASVTRSRRAEGLNPFPHSHSLGATLTRGRNNTSAATLNQRLPPTVFPKRPRDNPERVLDTFPSPKRPRLTINLSSSPPTRSLHPKTDCIDPKPTARPRTGPRSSAQSAPISDVSAATSVLPQQALPTPTPQKQQQQQPPAHQPLEPQQQQHQQQPLQQPSASTAAPRSKPAASSATQPKPRNPAKRELGSLQVDKPTPKAAEGRKLRSQEATRFKSDLAAYFPDYDEVIGNDPKPDHLLDGKTPVVLIDQAQPRSGALRLSHATRDYEGVSTALHDDGYPIRSYGDNLFTDLWESQEISFAFLQARDRKAEDVRDPLPDSYFETAHKKAERAEKTIRNSERGRAQHEKEQIIRLLDGLQGPDWLRTMGVSGITEGKKKEFEGPRRYFIRGCEAILEKFRQWGVEEKRRKLEKDRALAAAAQLENGHGPHDGALAADGGQDERSDMSGAVELVTDTDIDPPDSDIDASIAKQLRDETKARSKAVTKKAPVKRSRRQQELAPPPPPPPPLEPVPPKPFISFFDKRYLRDAALNKTRRKGRTVLAWGHTVPDMDQADFEIPPEFLDEKTLRSNARRKRRDKRGSRR